MFSDRFRALLATETPTNEFELELCAMLAPPSIEELPHHAALRTPVHSFLENFRAVSRMGSTPLDIAQLVIEQQRCQDRASLEVLGNIDPPHESHPQFDRWYRRLQELWASTRAEANTQAGHLQVLAYSAQMLETLQAADEAVREGLRSTRRSMISAAWTAHEILASGLWEASLNTRPCPLATLRGTFTPRSASTESIGKANVSSAVAESQKTVRLDLLESNGFDLSSKMGSVLRDRFSFQKLDGIREAYTKAFGTASPKVCELIHDERLTALAATRHVLVPIEWDPSTI